MGRKRKRNPEKCTTKRRKERTPSLIMTNPTTSKIEVINSEKDDSSQDCYLIEEFDDKNLLLEKDKLYTIDDLKSTIEEFDLAYEAAEKLQLKLKNFEGIRQDYLNIRKKLKEPDVSIGFYGRPMNRKSSTINFLLSRKKDFLLPTSYDSGSGCTKLPMRCVIKNKQKYCLELLQEENKQEKLEFNLDEEKEIKEKISNINNDGLNKRNKTNEILINIPLSQVPNEHKFLENVYLIDFLGYPDSQALKQSQDPLIINRNSLAVKRIIHDYYNLDSIFFFGDRGTLQLDTLKNMWKNDLFTDLINRYPSKLVSVRFENEKDVIQSNIDSISKPEMKQSFIQTLTSEEGFDYNFDAENSQTEVKVDNKNKSFHSKKCSPLEIERKHSTVPEMINRFKSLMLIELENPNSINKSLISLKEIIQELKEYKIDLLLSKCVAKMVNLTTQLMIKCKARLYSMRNKNKHFQTKLRNCVYGCVNLQDLVFNLTNYLVDKFDDIDITNEDYDEEELVRNNLLTALISQTMQKFCDEILKKLTKATSNFVKTIIEKICKKKVFDKNEDLKLHVKEMGSLYNDTHIHNILVDKLKIETLKTILHEHMVKKVQMKINGTEETYDGNELKEHLKEMGKKLDNILDEIREDFIINEPNEVNIEDIENIENIRNIVDRLKKVDGVIKTHVQNKYKKTKNKEIFHFPVPILNKSTYLELPNTINLENNRLKIDDCRKFIQIEWIKNKLGKNVDDRLNLNKRSDIKTIKNKLGKNVDDRLNSNKSDIKTIKNNICKNVDDRLNLNKRSDIKTMESDLTDELKNEIENYGFDTLIEIKLASNQKTMIINCNKEIIANRVEMHKKKISEFYANELSFEKISENKDLVLFPIFILPTISMPFWDETSTNILDPIMQLIELCKVGKPDGFLIFVLFESRTDHAVSDFNNSVAFYGGIISDAFEKVKKYDHIKDLEAQNPIIPVILPYSNLGSGRIRKICMLIAEHFKFNKFYCIDDNIQTISEYEQRIYEMKSYKHSFARALLYMYKVMIDGIKGNDNKKIEKKEENENNHNKLPSNCLIPKFVRELSIIDKDNIFQDLIKNLWEKENTISVLFDLDRVKNMFPTLKKEVEILKQYLEGPFTRVIGQVFLASTNQLKKLKKCEGATHSISSEKSSVLLINLDATSGIHPVSDETLFSIMDETSKKSKTNEQQLILEGYSDTDKMLKYYLIVNGVTTYNLYHFNYFSVQRQINKKKSCVCDYYYNKQNHCDRKSEFNCQCKNIIYLIRCSTCDQAIYTGQTANTSERIKRHLYQIKKVPNSRIFKHFNSDKHNGLKDFNFEILEKDIDLSTQIKQKENHFMILHNTKYPENPNGLNMVMNKV